MAETTVDLTAPIRSSLRVVETLGEDGEMRLSRCCLDAGSSTVLTVATVRDRPPAGICKRLEQEYALRGELDPAWAACPLELRHEGGRILLVLADPGGRLLERMTGSPFEIGRFLRLAVRLAAAVGKVHQQGLIHKDVTPAHMLVDAAGQVRLTGFGLASRLPRERQAPAPPEMIAGTLAYMAPEQTGRMNRSVDARSDLYALGVTFYEMLTGSLPFAAADPLEWIHCHIARQPVPPSERVTTVPAQLSAMVMKLLAKTAEERYQTAGGVETDLRRSLAEWEAHGRIDPFPPGERDTPDRLLIPEKLYGREREIATLHAAFDRVAAHGATGLTLVSGYSGIGKSSVVNELHKALVPPRGLFASGKFDQFKRDIPYATLAQAFQRLVREILGRSEAEVDQWRDALREALGQNGQLIGNLIPELELVIGRHPPPSDLPPQDAQNRFQMVFRRFLGVFARPEHPLALFLDDLQWLDIATLELLEHLVTHPEVRHLLLVGAYRDNEVGPAHPLTRTLEAIRTAGARVEEIVLAPLGRDDVGRLIADVLHCHRKRARPLAQLVHDKTSGNPFFAIQFLIALADERLLVLDPVASAWQWDINRIRAKGYTDNVVDLTVGKLMRLPPTTQDALKQLACLGNVAEVAALAQVHGAPEEAIHTALREAVYKGLVVLLDGAYKFLHDRIQQAAYSLIPEASRVGVHLRIGRALLASMTADDLAEHLFEVANQFNRGAAQLIERDEKTQVAAIELRAGRKAKASAAYASACVYLTAGMALLDETEWRSQYELMFRLRLECAECEFLSGNFDKAEQLIEELLQHGASIVDQAAVYHLKVFLYVMKSEYRQAVDSAITCLRLFGIDIPAHPSREQVQAEYEAVWRNLEGRSIESLLDLPLMTDPKLKAAMRLLSTIFDATYFTDFYLFCLHLCRMVNISLRHGTSGASAHACAFLAFTLGPMFHRPHEGYRFAKVACDLVEKHGFMADQAKVHQAMGIVALWTQPITTAIDFTRAACRTTIETGDFATACYSYSQTIIGLLLRNDPLDAVWRESEKGLDFVLKAKFRDAADIIVSQQRFIAAMRGWTRSFSSFSDARFDEATFEAQMTSDRMLTMICWYWILKSKARFLSGDYSEALAAADKAKALLWASAGQVMWLDYFFYTALTIAALYETASAEDQSRWRDLLTTHQDQLREWAQNYPPTFGDKYALVSAEIARLEGRDLDAMRLYEQAIQSARENGFIQNEGLDHEVAARFYTARGFETIAHAYLRNARYCYLRWGAAGKVRQLDQCYPRLREESTPSPPAATIGAPVEQLDIGTVLKASQAVSSEIDLGKLIEMLLRIAVEHAGAERALLVLCRSGEARIEAEATTGRGRVEVTHRPESAAPAEFPESILRTVIRTQQSVLLDDASARNPFSADAYIRRKRVRSVLCLPLVKQGELIGVLHLENNLASHVFTPARISVLELLSSQAAVSLENARLYRDLRMSEERWRSLFENVPIGVALIGSHGHYVETNPAFRRMTGYSEAELQLLSPVNIVHEDDRAATEAIIAASTAGQPGAPRYEKRFRRKDGGVIWAEISAFLVPVAGSTPLLAVVAVDITDRRRAEDELRHNEAYLAEAQRLSQTGSFGWDVASGNIFWSDETFQIFGYDKAPSATLDMVLQRIHPDDLAFVQRTIDRVTRDGDDINFSYRLLLPDGSVKYVHAVGHTVKNAAASIECVGAVTDITAAKEADDKLRRAQADLARVTRVTTLGEVTTSIVHEIVQPLSAVVTNGNTCLYWLDDKNADLAKARSAAERTVRDAERTHEIIGRIQALMIRSKPQKLEMDMNSVVSAILALTHDEFIKRHILVSAELAEILPPVLGDRVQLQQLMLNLIMNGIEAMASVTGRPKELIIATRAENPGRVVTLVRDSGTGLDPEKADEIFQPFVTTKPEGTGMGLAICRSIVEAHAGRIWASPGEPHGAVFQFTLPTVGLGDS